MAKFGVDYIDCELFLGGTMESGLDLLNKELEEEGTLDRGVMVEWLWGSEPEAKFSTEVLLNRNHLLGLLVCRHKSLSTSKRAFEAGRLSIMKKPVGEMSMREWKDTVSNLVIEWPVFVERLEQNPNSKENMAGAKELLEQCAGRFGSLAWGAWDDRVMDDVSDCEPRKEDGLLVMTKSAMRRGLSALMVLYRHLYLIAVCENLEGEARDVKVNKFHHEASMQDFFTWYMHFQLPVAAKLIYRHDFPGMYNHVSQPVYFHNPEFERPQRMLWDDPLSPAVHLLPSLCQLYPEVPVRFEEECLNPTKSASWYWLVVAGRVYLVTPEPKVLYSRDASVMLGYYLDHRDTGRAS